MLCFKISVILLANLSKSTEDKFIKYHSIISGFLAVTILLVIGLACSSFGEKLEFNGGELYYTKNVNESEAKKLGEYLVKTGYFSGKPATVQLDKSGTTYQVRLVIKKELQNDKEFAEAAKESASQFSKEVFNNATTEIHICDDQLKTIQVVKP